MSLLGRVPGWETPGKSPLSGTQKVYAWPFATAERRDYKNFLATNLLAARELPFKKYILSRFMQGGPGSVRLQFAHGTALSFLCCIGERPGKPPKKQGFLIPTEPRKSLKKNEKALRKGKGILPRKKSKDSNKIGRKDRAVFGSDGPSLERFFFFLFQCCFNRIGVCPPVL